MSEATMRANVLDTLRELDALAVENPIRPGTPDVNYVEGWIELKWLRRWPKVKEGVAVKIDHYTPQQRRWLARRHRKGGAAFLLLQVGRDWLLFRGDVAAEHVGRCSRARLFELAHRSWVNGLKREELVLCLTDYY